MAAIQTVHDMPSVPPKLANKSHYCYCNSLFQCLFNLKNFWEHIQQINENDTLKKISNIFSDSEGKYFGLKLYNEFDDFVPFQKISKNDICHREHDPAEFFSEIISYYKELALMFRINNFSDPQISTYITINTNFKSIQKGLDERTKNSDDEFLYCPDILCIKIERITPKGLDNTKIDINETLTFSIENENGSKYD